VRAAGFTEEKILPDPAGDLRGEIAGKTEGFSCLELTGVKGQVEISPYD
jgi:hypothetical protein